MNARTAARPWVACILLASVGSLAEACPQESQEQLEAQQEAQKIVARIRKSMREVNKLLLKGGSETQATEAAQAAARDLDELLDEAQSSARTVISGLDELMRLASENPPSGGGGGGQSDQDPPPSQGDNSGAKREKSKDPQELAEQTASQNQGQDPKQDSQDPQKDPKQSGEQQPQDGKPDGSDPQQSKSAQAPPGAETGEFQNENTAGRWGVLPAKEAEDLQRHAVDEFPQRYRHWMDLYYKRVNKQRD